MRFQNLSPPLPSINSKKLTNLRQLLVKQNRESLFDIKLQPHTKASSSSSAIPIMSFRSTVRLPLKLMVNRLIGCATYSTSTSPKMKAYAPATGFGYTLGKEQSKSKAQVMVNLFQHMCPRDDIFIDYAGSAHCKQQPHVLAISAAEEEAKGDDS
ncbi:hypothetical protein GH714_025304 [Hevea brasiliensis]|uniref:Uncharacterized protein n=1 Tax=Hevea brasiliensis TaxID=3981 RepID=A0A6A6MCZ5_HEVBR|nr:hypothetical protein GH714_025304 [Hevea brasiliensis]